MTTVNKSRSVPSLGMDLLFFTCLGIKFDIVHSNVITVLLFGVVIYEGYKHPTD